MKKTLTILTIAILAILAFTSCVNAASVVVNPSTTQKITSGSQVKVVVTADGRGAGYQLKYDTEKFSFDTKGTQLESPSIMSINSNYNGTGNIFISDPTSNTQTLVFVASEDLEVPAGETAEQYLFTAIKLQSVGADEVASISGTLTITPATPTDPEPADPSGSEAGNQGSENSGSGSSESGKPVDKNGNQINKIPDAGTPVFAGVIALIAISGAVLVIKNRK